MQIQYLSASRQNLQQNIDNRVIVYIFVTLATKTTTSIKTISYHSMNQNGAHINMPSGIQDVLGFIDSLSSAMKRVNKWSGRLGVFVLLPFAYIFSYIFMWGIYLRLSKDYTGTEITISNYKSAKKMLSAISGVSKAVAETSEKVGFDFVNNPPLPIWILLMPVIKILRALLGAGAYFDKKLADLDKVDSPLLEGFELSTENEVWQSRSEPYKYVA